MLYKHLEVLEDSVNSFTYIVYYSVKWQYKCRTEGRKDESTD